MPGTAEVRRAILLVEDQEGDAALIKRAIEESGIDNPIRTVANGILAMSYLSGDPPFHDRGKYPLPILILLDVRMPGPDGFEVLSWIRHHRDFSKIPVAMLTGGEAVADAQRAYQLGANTFLVKSFDFESKSDLSRTVRRLITQGERPA